MSARQFCVLVPYQFLTLLDSPLCGFSQVPGNELPEPLSKVDSDAVPR